MRDQDKSDGIRIIMSTVIYVVTFALMYIGTWIWDLFGLPARESKEWEIMFGMSLFTGGIFILVGGVGIALNFIRTAPWRMLRWTSGIMLFVFYFGLITTIGYGLPLFAQLIFVLGCTIGLYYAVKNQFTGNWDWETYTNGGGR